MSQLLQGILPTGSVFFFLVLKLPLTFFSLPLTRRRPEPASALHSPAAEADPLYPLSQEVREGGDPSPSHQRQPPGQVVRVRTSERTRMDVGLGGRSERLGWCERLEGDRRQTTSQQQQQEKGSRRQRREGCKSSQSSSDSKQTDRNSSTHPLLHPRRQAVLLLLLVTLSLSHLSRTSGQGTHAPPFPLYHPLSPIHVHVSQWQLLLGKGGVGFTAHGSEAC